MRVLMINSVCGIRSTGRICTGLARKLETQGHEVKIAYGREGYVPEEDRRFAVRIGNGLDVYMHALKARLGDASGLSSRKATRRFLEWADSYDPDLLWLHNIHGYYIDIIQLFEWIKRRPRMEVRWTLHDCWAFTGHCPHFTYVSCEKWQSGCHDCPQLERYPRAFIDRSARNYELKKELFTGIGRLTIQVPSKWLKGLVEQSFLKDYPIEVVPNRIDEQIFRPSPSSFRKEHGLEDKFIVLGVASSWDRYKGIDDFVRLAGMLDDDYKIVMVGLNKKQIKRMPDSILCIERTNDQRQLAEIYTAADVLLNASYEDNYPTVDLEAQACGTKVIAYDCCGNPETVKDGILIDVSGKDHLDAVAGAIKRLRFSADRQNGTSDSR